MLSEILPPTELQVGAVEVALEQVVQECGLSEGDVTSRRQVLSSMEEVIRATLPGTSPTPLSPFHCTPKPQPGCT